MLSHRQKLSPRLKFWLGFLWCPIIAWIFFGAQIFLAVKVDSAFPHFFGNTGSLVGAFLLLHWLGYWVSVALFCGFGAAFFWNGLAFSQWEKGFWSVPLIVAPLFGLNFYLAALLALLLLLPLVIFFGIYCIGLEQGRKFWSSNGSREWLGNFSDPDVGAENEPPSVQQ